MRMVSVFCGASKGKLPSVQRAAIALAEGIAARGWGVVYGGGHVGLMGMVADTAMRAGTEVIGVIPRFMDKAEEAHTGVTRLLLVEDMHERKMQMHRLSHAAIALPGGFGTLDELFEILTWRQIGLHRQPVGLLNVEGFYSPLLAQVDHMASTGFLHGDTRLLVAEDVDELLDRMGAAMDVATPG